MRKGIEEVGKLGLGSSYRPPVTLHPEPLKAPLWELRINEKACSDWHGSVGWALSQEGNGLGVEF